MDVKVGHRHLIDALKSPRTTMALMVTWGLAVGAGLLLLGAHAGRRGAAGNPAARWPAATCIRPERSRPNLILLLHPRCPCSRATLTELARIMARCQGRVTAHVLVFRPATAPEAWGRSDLRHAAAAIPGVRVYDDEGGTEAKRFGGETSGQVLLFDSTGRLVFDGGITGARGHEGDNSGHDAVAAWLLKGQAERAKSPVFGCSLLDPTPTIDRKEETWQR